ncbi:MAG: PIN domain-containing protein [Pirellulaceae bacterium]
MRCFVDTSAFLAILNRDDENHSRAARQWEAVLGEDWDLVTTSYVLVETFSVCQARLGIKAARAFHTNVTPLLSVEWISAERHAAAASAVLAAGKRKLSLVDCVSFETMRQLNLNHAFAFDRHFREQGFVLVP